MVIRRRSSLEEVLRFWPVDKKVGQVRNDGPELIERSRRWSRRCFSRLPEMEWRRRALA